MHRSFRYQLSPTAAQERVLCSWLELTREFYNAALQERRDAFVKQGISVTWQAQSAEISSVREARPDFLTIPVVVLRGAIRRLDRAFSGLFSKRGGYPRFKSSSRWNSLLIDDIGSTKQLIVSGGRRVAIPLLGKIKFKQHRLLEGKPKGLRIKRHAGHWFITFVCDQVPKHILPATGMDVGIDLGLSTFVATSDDELFDNVRAMKNRGADLSRAQRRVERRKLGSERRRRAIQQVAKKHARIAAVRREHAITVSGVLVAKYDTIYVEDLNIAGLICGHLGGSIRDAGWVVFLRWLHVKAESAGREVIKVNPRGTSQNCSRCGVIVQKGLAVRVHNCSHCGLVIDRDVNAARNVLWLGRSLRGAALVVKRRRRSAKIQSTP